MCATQRCSQLASQPATKSSAQVFDSAVAIDLIFRLAENYRRSRRDLCMTCILCIILLRAVCSGALAFAVVDKLFGWAERARERLDWNDRYRCVAARALRLRVAHDRAVWIDKNTTHLCANIQRTGSKKSNVDKRQCAALRRLSRGVHNVCTSFPALSYGKSERMVTQYPLRTLYVFVK